jgi:hypothetical protein
VATNWIVREGKRILYTDFRNCVSEAEMEALFEKAARIVEESPTPVLTLNNFEGVAASLDFVRAMRTRARDYQHNVKAKAVLGVTGVKRTLLNTYSVLTGIDARGFETEAEAIAYLVSKG